MHLAIRLTFASLAVTSVAGPVRAASPVKPSEYKHEDQSHYLKADVLKADPKAIIMPLTAASHTGDSYFIPGRRHPAKEIYLQQVSDWIEPVTPPEMPPNLNIPLDVMQVREPHGDVQVALPAAPANFNAVSDGMVLPNGSVVRTGGSGTAAVLFGGVDSVRLAPNSQAAVQLAVTPTLRDAEVDLHSGTAFSKVGLRIGEKEDYQVHTSFGVISAHGTDFASVALPERVDVWVAQGTVQLISPEGEGARSQTVTAEGKGALKVMRYPVAKDAQAAMMESAETLSAALAVIPMSNQKLKTLSDRQATGAKLTARETDYLGRIRKVSFLIKLTLVPPPAPPPSMVVPKPPPAPTALQSHVSSAKAVALATTSDPNSLTPKETLSPRKVTDAGTEGENVPKVRQRKVSLDLREQDTSSSKPVASGPNDTVP